MSDATVGLSFKLKVGDGATPEVFTAIAEVTDIPGGPSTSAEDVDCTSTDSNGWREFKKGLKDGGEIQFTCNAVMNATSHAQLISDAEDGTIRNYQLCWGDDDSTYTTETIQAFAAYVKDVKPTFGIGNIVKLDGTLKVSGQVTTTARHAA